MTVRRSFYSLPSALYRALVTEDALPIGRTGADGERREARNGGSLDAAVAFVVEFTRGRYRRPSSTPNARVPSRRSLRERGTRAYGVSEKTPRATNVHSFRSEGSRSRGTEGRAAEVEGTRITARGSFVERRYLFPN